MIIVSDTSPITNLLQIGDLDLLHQIFGTIIIPNRVFTELCQIESQKEILTNQFWIVRATLSDPILKDELLKELDEGEAIALAVDLEADFLLMDEQKGRQIAESYGLKVVGILGVLIQAKEKGLISEIKPHLQRLINEAGFWLNPQLVEKILELVKEN